MKIQFLNGGLANQVFQYLFARGYELTNPGAIMYLDDSYFALHSVHNGYELTNVFGIHPHMVSSLFETDVWEYILNQKKEGLSLPQILSNNGCLSPPTVTSLKSMVTQVMSIITVTGSMRNGGYSINLFFCMNCNFRN